MPRKTTKCFVLEFDSIDFAYFIGIVMGTIMTIEPWYIWVPGSFVAIIGLILLRSWDTDAV